MVDETWVPVVIQGFMLIVAALGLGIALTKLRRAEDARDRDRQDALVTRVADWAEDVLESLHSTPAPEPVPGDTGNFIFAKQSAMWYLSERGRRTNCVVASGKRAERIAGDLDHGLKSAVDETMTLLRQFVTDVQAGMGRVEKAKTDSWHAENKEIMAALLSRRKEIDKAATKVVDRTTTLRA